MANPTNKIIRLFTWCVVTLLSIAIIIPIAAFLYFDPNDFKEEVSHFITEKSGLPLEIKGNIEMKYFPWLGITVHDVSMPQASSFGAGNFIKVETLDFKMPLRELLQKQFIVETLTLKGLEINLQKNTDGKSNWEVAQNQVKQKRINKDVSQEKTALPEDKASKPSKSKQKLNFKMAHFEITDSAISYDDKSQGQTIQLSALELKGEQGEQLVFLLKGQFDVQQNSSKNKAPDVKGHIAFDGQATLADTISAQFDIRSNAELNQNQIPWKNLNATMRLDLKANKTLNINDIHLNLDSQVIDGKASIPADESAPITFTLSTKMLDLNKLNSKTSAPQATKAAVVKTSMSSSSSASAKSSASGRALSGEVTIDKLKVSNIELNNVKAIVKKTGNVLKLSPLTANLFQGTLNAQVSKDLKNPSAPTMLLGDLINIQIQPMLETLKNEKRLMGVANINFNLAQTNETNGIVKVNIKNGVIDGLDVRYYLSLAQSLVSNNKQPTEDTKRTAFGDLSATLNIHDQTIDNNDLAIVSSDFTAKGEGSIYLGSKTIEYKMQAWKKYSDGKERPNDLPLAIRIKGPLEHPKVEPDVDLYLKKGLEQEVKKQLNKQVEKNIGKILGTDNATTQEGQALNPEQQIQQKIEDKINKGLNKLLKKKKKE